MESRQDTVVYGEPYSFMKFDLKKAKEGFYTDELQQIMTIRKEANFYDIAPEVVKQAWDIAEADDLAASGYIVPPSRRGYMRLSIDDNTPMIKDGLPRLNGVLWDGATVYIIHDQGIEDQIAIAPMKLTINLEATETTGAIEIWGAGPEDVKPWQRIGVRIIAPSFVARREALMAMQGPIEEMLSLMKIIFDMLSETKATTVERQTERRAFASKHGEYFETLRVVKISLSKCRAKYLKQAHEKTGRTNAWHEVRSHFRHRRVTKPDCAHHWLPRYAEDDGKHYKCGTCGEIKTRVSYPNGAGDRSKGSVRHNYEIVA